MACECYHSGCKNHNEHKIPDSGPFCDKQECTPNFIPGSVVNQRGYVICQPVHIDPKLWATKATLTNQTVINTGPMYGAD